MNSLLGKTRPPFSLFNEVNGGWVYTGDDRQGVAWYSSAECSPNVDNLSLGQLVPRSTLTPQVNKSGAPLVSGIVGQSNPLKVFWSVVQLIAIDVVDRKSLSVAKNKSNCNQSMHGHFGALVAKFCRHLKVAPAVQGWSQNLFFVYRDKMLACPVFVPSCVGRPSRSQDAAILTNKPLNAFLVNGYFFHAVNNTAQHG